MNKYNYKKITTTVFHLCLIKKELREIKVWFRSLLKNVKEAFFFIVSVIVAIDLFWELWLNDHTRHKWTKMKYSWLLDFS